MFKIEFIKEFFLNLGFIESLVFDDKQPNVFIIKEVDKKTKFQTINDNTDLLLVEKDYAVYLQLNIVSEIYNFIKSFVLYIMQNNSLIKSVDENYDKVFTELNGKSFNSKEFKFIKFEITVKQYFKPENCPFEC